MQLKFDWWILVPVIILSLISLIMIWSIAPTELTNQIFFLVIGLLMFVLISQADPVGIFSFAKVGYLLSLGFLLIPYLLGIANRGAFRWINIGQFTLQPSELVKPVLLVYFSTLATNRDTKGWWLITALLIPVSIIFFQPDLSTAILVSSAWIIISLSHFPVRSFIIGFLILLMAAFPTYLFVLKDYQKDRITSFFNPYSDPLGKGYHAIQSIIAAGSGGIFGKGLGRGTQSQLRFLPEQHTDFMFASTAESLGLIGSILILTTYLILLRRLYILFQLAQTRAQSYFCLGLMGMLWFQIISNIGMNIGILPVTGVTLPLISYGGSSLLSVLLSLALVNGIWKHAKSIG